MQKHIALATRYLPSLCHLAKVITIVLDGKPIFLHVTLIKKREAG